MVALQVPRLRAERKTLTVDPRFTHVVDMVRAGYFGWEDYFSPIMDAITTGACVWAPGGYPCCILCDATGVRSHCNMESRHWMCQRHAAGPTLMSLLVKPGGALRFVRWWLCFSRQNQYDGGWC